MLPDSSGNFLRGESVPGIMAKALASNFTKTGSDHLLNNLSAGDPQYAASLMKVKRIWAANIIAQHNLRSFSNKIPFQLDALKKRFIYAGGGC